MTVPPVVTRAAGVREQMREVLAPASRVVTTTRAKAAPVTSIVTPLGWALLAFGTICWVVGWRCGWVELLVVAAATWGLIVLSLLLVLGRAKLDVKLEANPQRVVVGRPAAGSVGITNVAKGLMLPIGLELPVGPGIARFAVPTLRPGSEHEELFIVPTERRGVIVVGPARTVRGDPFGLLQKMVSWTQSIDVYVHPVTVPLQPLGAGLLRDLEGQTTDDLSNSDLAFHALREYQPGDDRRHIHWKSSAKAGKFLIRQFQDTRRSHICVVVDSALASYPDSEDYEVAISAAASITLRAFTDEHQVSVFAGHAIAPNASGNRVLDVFSKAQLGGDSLTALARGASRMTPDASTAFFLTGAETTFQDIRRAANEFPAEVRTVALRVDRVSPTAVRVADGITVLGLQQLGDLAKLLQGGIA